MYAEECFDGNFIGADFGVSEDLSDKLPEEWKVFNRDYSIPRFQERHPEKSRISAGLAGGALWMVSKGIRKGDVVLCPAGNGRFHVGEVIGEYAFQAGQHLPHRRPVRWLTQSIDRAEMSEALKNSAGAIGTVSTITQYADEIERLLSASVPESRVQEVAEELASFALEKHLEDFLVQNWAQTDFGKSYDIYEEEGERVGQQYATDTGPLDILAVSKDKKRLLVIELKKGRASDAVIGQLLRYMGYVQEELAEKGQTVEGAIIALEDDPRVRRALAMLPTVQFLRYQISFRLVKA